MKSKMLVCAVIFGVFACGTANSGGEKQPKPAPVADSRSGGPVQAKGGDDELARLGKARLDAAQKAYALRVKRSDEEGENYSDVRYYFSIRWLNAQLDLARTKDARVAAYTGHLERMKAWEKRQAVISPGKTTEIFLAPFLTEAEYWLARERATSK